MLIKEIMAHQDALREFCSIRAWYDPHAVTLTMKQGARFTTPTSTAAFGSQGTEGIFVGIDHNACVQNLKQFRNLLDRAAYGNAVRRYGKRLRIIPVLEGSSIVRYHYHISIDRPVHIERDAFAELISSCWGRTTWGYKHLEVRPDADDGWTRYMLKCRTKASYDLSIDWANYHNPDCRA